MIILTSYFETCFQKTFVTKTCISPIRWITFLLQIFMLKVVNRVSLQVAMDKREIQQTLSEALKIYLAKPKIMILIMVLSLDCLNDNMKMIKSEVILSNNSIKDEMMKRYEMLNEKLSLMEKTWNEKLSLIEKTLKEKIERLSETNKSVAKNFKKQEEDLKDLQSKISQISKSVNNLPNKINGYKEQCDKTLQESVKKILKNYEANKKQAQKMQDLCSQIDKILCKVNTPDELLNCMQEKLENVFDQKLKSLDDYIKNTTNLAVQAMQFKGSKSSVQDEMQSLKRRNYYLSKNSPENSLFKKQTGNEYYYSGWKSENSNIMKPTEPKIRATPLAQYINNLKNKKNNPSQYSLSSRGTPDNNAGSHKYRAKTTVTPLSKIISPFKRPLIPKPTRSTYEPYPSQYYNNTGDQTRCNQNSTQTFSFVHFEASSSPGLTVYDAASFAKGHGYFKR